MGQTTCCCTSRALFLTDVPRTHGSHRDTHWPLLWTVKQEQDTRRDTSCYGFDLFSHPEGRRVRKATKTLHIISFNIPNAEDGIQSVPVYTVSSFS